MLLGAAGNPVDPVAPYLVMQGRMLQPEQARRLYLIAARLKQRTFNQVNLKAPDGLVEINPVSDVAGVLSLRRSLLRLLLHRRGYRFQGRRHLPRQSEEIVQLRSGLRYGRCAPALKPRGCP